MLVQKRKTPVTIPWFLLVFLGKARSPQLPPLEKPFGCGSFPTLQGHPLKQLRCLLINGQM